MYRRRIPFTNIAFAAVLGIGSAVYIYKPYFDQNAIIPRRQNEEVPKKQTEVDKSSSAWFPREQEMHKCLQSPEDLHESLADCQSWRHQSIWRDQQWSTQLYPGWIHELLLNILSLNTSVPQTILQWLNVSFHLISVIFPFSSVSLYCMLAVKNMLARPPRRCSDAAFQPKQHRLITLWNVLLEICRIAGISVVSKQIFDQNV